MSILKELEKKLPKDAEISEVKFEASEIVLYTKNKEFFQTCEGVVREIVRALKKRIEIRPDLTITMDMEKTKKFIEDTVPQDAGIKAIYFEPEMGKVVIEAQKPGLIIGKNGETYRNIKNTTFWLPKIERAPAIESDIVRAVRNLIHTEIDYRKKFLNKIGQKINTVLEDVDKNKEWVRVTFLGSARFVGRSSFLLQTKHSNILVDFGAQPGSSELPYMEAPEFNLEKIDAIVLSHSHIDHCAYVPYLYDLGYSGPAYMTAPTRDLSVLLCMDYIDILQREGQKPPYTKKAVEKMVKHTVTLDFGEVSDITPDIRLTLQPSGHLLGSSLVHLHIGDGLHNILYTGDFKFSQTRLFDPAYTNFQRVETLISESTYGAAEDMLPPRKDVEQKLFDCINTVMKRGGKVIIPSFAVGRGQEIMATLASNREFNYPVYIEGMIWDATAIHTAYPEYLSQYMQREIFRYGKNPFLSEIFKRVAPVERDKVIDSAEPAVIMATSGMLIGGPVMEYLKALAGDKKNMLLFSGYQGEGTLGRRIQKGWKEIPLVDSNGKNRLARIELEVDTVHGLTGHAGRRELVNYIHKLSSRPERVIFVHGEAKKCVEMASYVHRNFRMETAAPRAMEAIRLK